MNVIRKLKDIWKKLMYILNRSQKKLGVLVFFMTLAGAVFETFGVSVIAPLVQVLLNPEELLKNAYVKSIMDFLHIVSAEQVILVVITAVIILYLLKNLYLILLSWVRSKYSCKIQREMSVLMLNSYMGREYEFFLNNNVGDLMRGVSTDVQGVYDLVYQGFRITAEILTIICICIYMCVSDWVMAVTMVLLALSCMLGIMILFKKKMGQWGALNRDYYAELNQHLLHAFQGIKEVVVMRRQQFFSDAYEKTYMKRQKCEIGQVVGAESPAYIIEGVCITGVLLAVYFRISGLENTQNYVPTLASFAVAAFRILPSLGRLSSSFNQFMFMLPTLDAVYTNIHEVRTDAEKMKDLQAQNESGLKKEDFQGELRAENVSWRYAKGNRDILKGLNICIKKGQSIGLVGQSGAGKTTLADLFLGILRPQSGIIRADGIDIVQIGDNWSKIIGYVPQNIYLTEQSIKENVAFGIEKEKIDDKKVETALEQAQLADVVADLPEGINTLIGERGIKLSGGQRQRIAIARALYEDPEIIIFDEATAALDTETEQMVMESLESLQGKKTLIIIAHRLTTIKHCDVIYEIADGKAVVRTYEELTAE